MFDKFNKVDQQNILVIGDIILDKYIFGKTDRISPEAPVPVVNVNNRSMALGGAANVAANLKALGAKCHLIGALGHDENGNALRRMLDENFPNAYDVIISKKRTTAKTRILSKGQQLLRVDEEDTSALSSAEQNQLLSKVESNIKSGHITGIILQDYDKGIFSKEVIANIIALANQNNLPTFVDPKHANFWEYSNVTIFKPNLSELENANKSTNKLELESLLHHTYNKLQCKILICTLAEKGNVIIENENITFTPTEKIDVVDVSGAGDSALAIISLSYLLGYEIKDIATLANLSGRAACLQTGVSTVSMEEIKNAFLSSYHQ